MASPRGIQYCYNIKDSRNRNTSDMPREWIKIGNTGLEDWCLRFTDLPNGRISLEVKFENTREYHCYRRDNFNRVEVLHRFGINRYYDSGIGTVAHGSPLSTTFDGSLVECVEVEIEVLVRIDGYGICWFNFFKPLKEGVGFEMKFRNASEKCKVQSPFKALLEFHSPYFARMIASYEKGIPYRMLKIGAPSGLGLHFQMLHGVRMNMQYLKMQDDRIEPLADRFQLPPLYERQMIEYFRHRYMDIDVVNAWRMERIDWFNQQPTRRASLQKYLYSRVSNLYEFHEVVNPKDVDGMSGEMMKMLVRNVFKGELELEGRTPPGSETDSESDY